MGGARVAVAAAAPSDLVDCGECAGTGLSGGGADAAPCLYCDGTGVWEALL